ncbi:MAG: hypothetical protein ACREBD_32055, partial [Blastocatellia bacterium]
MPFSITFDIQQAYSSIEEGITIPTVLILGNITASFQAKIDPGAQVCLFQREIGEELGIDIESGDRIRLGSLTGGSLIAFGHSVTLHTLGLEFDSVVYFAADYGLERNLLGRVGWLQKVRLAIIDYDWTVY